MSTKTSKHVSRRDMLKAMGFFAGSAALAACAPATTVAPTKVPEATKPAEPTPTVQKKIEGKVVVMHFRHEFNEDMEKQIAADYPGVTTEFADASDLTRLYAMLAAGTPPDLVRVQAPSIPGMLARKLLFDLTPYFQNSKVLKLDDLMPANDYYKAESPLKIGTGKIYGMCKDFSPDFTIYANKQAFTDAGAAVPDDTKALTYAEVMDLSKKVAKFEGDRTLMFGYGYEAGWIDRIWMNMLAEKEISLYTAGYEKIVLSGNEETKNVVKWYYDMAKEKLAASPINPSPAGWFGTDFTAGQLAMAQYGFWYSAMADADKVQGNAMMLPGPTWSGVRRDPTMTATGMIMISKTQIPDAAWLVFEYYNGGKPSVDRAGSGWGVPALKSQLNLVPQGTDFQKQAFKVLNGELDLKTPPMQFNPFIGESEVSASWAKNLDECLRGNIDFDTMLKRIETEVNTSIKEGIDRIVG